MKNKKISEQIGRGFAYVQDALDRALTFGFSKMKSYGDKKPAQNAHPIKKGAKGIARFFGDMGTSFFGKYNELKQNRDTSKNSHPEENTPSEKKAPQKRKTK